MQLTYRGVTYQPSAPVTSIQLPAFNLTGKYRGKASSIFPPLKVTSQSCVHLKYRGVAYPHQFNNSRFIDIDRPISLRA